MKTCWFVVIRTPSAWWVDCEGKAYGPFDTQDQAAAEAVHLAEAFGDPARRSDVYVPDGAGKLQLVWSGQRQAPTG